MAEPGLRERKKRQTRQLILDTAARLFVERGFDRVTVTEIARAAELSEMTVFNYFPTKEDLVFARMEFFEEQLMAAVEQRPPEESALAAFSRMVLAGVELSARTDIIAKAAMLIRASPALQAREREITARYTARLAAIFTAETGSAGDDIEAWTAASALMAVHRGLLEHVRNAVLADRRGAQLTQHAVAQARRALARLESGLAGYPANSHS
jgi:AcrR family transcriptional regulator